jgi:hypothetical protein
MVVGEDNVFVIMLYIRCDCWLYRFGRTLRRSGTVSSISLELFGNMAWLWRGEGRFRTNRREGPHLINAEATAWTRGQFHSDGLGKRRSGMLEDQVWSIIWPILHKGQGAVGVRK